MEYCIICGKEFIPPAGYFCYCTDCFMGFKEIEWVDVVLEARRKEAHRSKLDVIYLQSLSYNDRLKAFTFWRYRISYQPEEGTN